MMKTLVKFASAALVAGMFSMNGQAAAVYCSDSEPEISAISSWTQGNGNGKGNGQTTHSVTISVDDFKYRGSSADDCYGVVVGNDSAGALNDESVFGFTNWVELTRFDAPHSTSPGTFDTGEGLLSFSLIYNGLFDGLHQYALNASANPGSLLPADMMLAAVIKHSNFWSAYLFKEVTIEADDKGSKNVGSFLTAFGPGNNGFSHFTFYGGNYSQQPPAGNDPPGVPVPGTLALMGLGLFAAGAMRRRRRDD